MLHVVLYAKDASCSPNIWDVMQVEKKYWCAQNDYKNVFKNFFHYETPAEKNPLRSNNEREILYYFRFPQDQN